MIHGINSSCNRYEVILTILLSNLLQNMICKLYSIIKWYIVLHSWYNILSNINQPISNKLANEFTMSSSFLYLEKIIFYAARNWFYLYRRSMPNSNISVYVEFCCCLAEAWNIRNSWPGRRRNNEQKCFHKPILKQTSYFYSCSEHFGTINLNHYNRC